MKQDERKLIGELPYRLLKSKPITTYDEAYRTFKRLHDLYPKEYFLPELINTGYKNKVISNNEVLDLRDFIMQSSDKKMLQMIKDLQLDPSGSAESSIQALRKNQYTLSKPKDQL